jgi:hypothetical protein
MRTQWGIAIAMLTLSTPVLGVTPAQKCEAGKLKIAGKYDFCRLKAEAKAAQAGNPPDYSKCDQKFADKWASTEAASSGMCPTSGDQASVQDQATTHTDIVALMLAGTRFVDNGDGTVTDVQTGLMWEQKTNSLGIHYFGSQDVWSATGTAPDGPPFRTFLATLNRHSSADGITSTGCFAGHCDWRLPTIEELQSIALLPCPIDLPDCIDPVFGPSGTGYWSATEMAGDPASAWIYVAGGTPSSTTKAGHNNFYRAVRSAW